MKNQYDYLRPEKAETFDLNQFKTEVENLPDFNDQLELWNRYFDLPTMGRKLSIDSGSKIHFHFYSESSTCGKGFTPEKQAVLTTWRRQYYQPLKVVFDQLTTYQERINFTIEHFGTALSTFVPEDDIEFSTLPETPQERQLYHQLDYDRWEKSWIDSSAFGSG